MCISVRDNNCYPLIYNFQYQVLIWMSRNYDEAFKKTVKHINLQNCVIWMNAKSLTDDWLRFNDIGQIIGAIYIDLKSVRLIQSTQKLCRPSYVVLDALIEWLCGSFLISIIESKELRYTSHSLRWAFCFVRRTARVRSRATTFLNLHRWFGSSP